MSSNPHGQTQPHPANGSPPALERAPYTLVFLGDLHAGGRLDALIPVDPDNLAEVLRRARPTLALTIKPPFGGGSEWEFALTFDSWRCFEPAGLLPQIPAARARLDLSEGIRDRRTGKLGEAELAAVLEDALRRDPTLAWLRETLPAPAGTASVAGPPGTPPGGSILDLVEEPSQTDRVSADVERLAETAATRAGQVGAVERRRLDAWQQRLAAELTAVSDAVLHHPDVRRLETAWRGLKLLVEGIDFRAGVRLAVLDVAREQAARQLNEKVLEPAFAGETGTPGLILFDYPCQNTPVDIALLDEIGRAAASLPVPVVFPLEAAFFGVKSAGLVKNLPNLSGLVDGWQFAKWRTLREQPHSRWLVAVFGRFLLRPPYAAQPDARTYAYDERVTGEGQLLWGGGHLALGLCAARAFASHGWPTRMFGAEAGRLANLPIATNPADAQKPWGPGDVTLPDRRLDELPAIGVNLLQSIPGKDYCLLLGGVTVAKPIVTTTTGKQPALLEVSLPYQQFSSLLGAWLCAQQTALQGRPVDEVQKHLLFGLCDLLGMKPEDAADAVAVGVGPAPDDPLRTLVQVRLTPPGRIVPGGLQVDFAFTVRS